MNTNIEVTIKVRDGEKFRHMVYRHSWVPIPPELPTRRGALFRYRKKGNRALDTTHVGNTVSGKHSTLSEDLHNFWTWVIADVVANGYSFEGVVYES